MFTQLSLFDLPTHFDPSTPVVTVSKPEAPAATVVAPPAVAAAAAEPVRPEPVRPEPVRIYGEARPGDTVQPLGDLARLVIARYEMVARRRQERLQRQAERPRPSIRVLSPS